MISHRPVLANRLTGKSGNRRKTIEEIILNITKGGRTQKAEVQSVAGRKNSVGEQKYTRYREGGMRKVVVVEGRRQQ